MNISKYTIFSIFKYEKFIKFMICGHYKKRVAVER